MDAAYQPTASRVSTNRDRTLTRRTDIVVSRVFIRRDCSSVDEPYDFLIVGPFQT